MFWMVTFPFSYKNFKVQKVSIILLNNKKLQKQYNANFLNFEIFTGEKESFIPKHPQIWAYNSF